MATKEEYITTLGKCAVCDFERAGHFCVSRDIVIPKSERKDGCAKFQWERS